jgi:glycosyltransferase involved in cell wall biosynthesis
MAPEPGPAPVSVIIPAYRAAATIGRTLASLAAQTSRPAEVVVIDDCSADGTVAAAEACRAALGGIRLVVLRQPANLGAGAARNRGLLAASQPLVGFLDADDEWLPEKLETSVVRLEASGADLVAHDVLIASHGREEYRDCARHCPADPEEVFPALFVRGFVTTSTVVARRSVLLAAGGFDPSLRSGQDYDLWLAACALPGVRLVVFSGGHTRWHEMPGSITTYVDRRRICNMAIIARQLPALRARGGAWMRTLLKRLAVIHYESLCGHWREGRRLRALAVPAALPLNLVRALRAALSPVRPRRFLDKVPG